MYHFYTSVPNWLAVASQSLALRFFYLVISLGLLAPASLRASGTDPHPDYAPLEALYNATNGPGWKNSNKWLTDNNPCGWYGISCRDNRVTDIYLSDNKLSGTLPESLGNLTSLQNLFLRKNDLSGSIPNSLGNLSNLKYLSLQENKLTGEIPSDLNKLTNLENLILSNNQFSGEIPGSLGNMSKLQSINLYSNQLSGVIPSSLGNLTNLQYLTLDYNQLSGEIPSSLGNLANLLSIIVSQNKLTGSIPASLGGMTNLQNLSLAFNKLTGAIPGSLGNLSNLQTIFLNNNELSGEIPGNLESLTKLSYLSFGTNKLTGIIPGSLGNLAKLQSLYLYENQLSGEIPASLGNLTNLQYLSLGGNKLTGVIPSSLGNLTNLKDLSIGTNQLSGSIPTSLGNLTNLQGINFNFNQLSGPIPDSFGNLINLTSLSMMENKLEGALPGSLGNLVSLRFLSLSANKLSGEIPASLGNLTKVWYLTLDYNELSGPIPGSLGNIAALEHLSLSRNQLTGSIPDNFRNLAKLDQFYLTQNQLTGSIPEFLGSLTNLRNISLNFNKLTGSIPASLGNLSKMQYLTLNDNLLIDAIPSSLGNLTNLLFLGLQNNQLSGPIPANLGNLSKLQYLWLYNNQLNGCFSETLSALCGKNVYAYNNPGLPGGGNFTAFCNNEPGSNSMSAPMLALTPGISQPILQNTPSVSLTVSGCEGGTVNWSGPNNTKGTGATIPVSTAAVATLSYSATCTVGSCVSPAGTASVVISTAPTTGNFDGFVYGVDCETFRGWAWNRDKVNTVISVDILDGANVIATIPAGDFRQDLLNAGKGNGKHAFSFPIPSSLKDGQPHLLTARVAGSSFLLKNPPKALKCQGSGGPVNQPPFAPTTIPGGISTSANYFISFDLPAFIDPENGALSYELTGLPSGLSFTSATRLISGMPTAGGSFTLTYSATDNQGAKSQVTIELTLTPLPAINQPPVAPTTSPLSATIGTSFSVTLPAFTDPESQSLTYSLFGLSAGLGFTASSRTISGTAAVGTAGWYVLTYSASDGTTNTPVNFTLTVNPAATTPPPVVTGNFEGYLSVVNCQEIRGWVWDRNKPNTPMMVEFFADGRSIGTVEARNFRQDLKDAQKGNGSHGYVFSTPAEVKDNINHQISAKVQNSTYVLKGSPMPLQCASSGRLSAEHTESLQAVLLGNPVSNQVSVEIRGAEGQPLRLQLTDVNGRLIHEKLVEKANAVESQTLPILNPMPGLLFLQVQSGSRSVTLKVLKH